MFQPPKGGWEIIPAWQSTTKDQRFDVTDRASLEDFLHRHKSDFGVMQELRHLLAATDPVGGFTDDQVIETIAWRVATRVLLMREAPRRFLETAGGGGGASADAKDATAALGAKTAAPAGHSPLPIRTKHWIGVTVVDQDGRPVKDVTVHGEVSDHNSFTVDMSTAAPEGTYKTDKIYDGTTCDCIGGRCRWNRYDGPSG